MLLKILLAFQLALLVSGAGCEAPTTQTRDVCIALGDEVYQSLTSCEPSVEALHNVHTLLDVQVHPRDMSQREVVTLDLNGPAMMLRLHPGSQVELRNSTNGRCAVLVITIYNDPYNPIADMVVVLRKNESMVASLTINPTTGGEGGDRVTSSTQEAMPTVQPTPSLRLTTPTLPSTTPISPSTTPILPSTTPISLPTVSPPETMTDTAKLLQITGNTESVMGWLAPATMVFLAIITVLLALVIVLVSILLCRLSKLDREIASKAI